jgi:hypothetical protein
MLSVIMLNVVILNVANNPFMLSVVMLSIVMLSVEATLRVEFLTGLHLGRLLPCLQSRLEATEGYKHSSFLRY